MKVRAKYQIAYDGVGYIAGNIFEIREEDYPIYMNDVVVIEEKDIKDEENKQLKKESNKQIKSSKTK